MARAGGESAARVRAARGYRGFSPQELAAALHVSRDTLWRLETGRKVPDADERAAIAKACDVPLVFLESGFAALERPVTDADRRILQLEEKLAGMDARLRGVEVEVSDADADEVVEELEQAADEVLEGLQSEHSPDEESAHGGAT